MPLNQTKKLIDTYGEKIKNASISDQELGQLLEPNTFTKSDGYVDQNQPISNSNHSKMDAIKDFVLTIGPDLSPEILHQVTARAIALSPSESTNTFMRGSSLEKAFLAYEMVKYPESAEDHFACDRIKTEFPKQNDIPNLKAVILNPIIYFFRNPQYVEESVALAKPQHTDREKLKPLTTDINYDDQLKKLISCCTDYQKHLNKSTDKNPELVKKKLEIVGEMLTKLKDESKDAPTRIEEMKEVLTETNRDILNNRRDSSSGVKFLENIVHIVTLGLYSKATKGTFAFWKSHGEAVVDTVDEKTKDSQLKI